MIKNLSSSIKFMKKILFKGKVFVYSKIELKTVKENILEGEKLVFREENEKHEIPLRSTGIGRKEI